MQTKNKEIIEWFKVAGRHAYTEYVDDTWHVVLDSGGIDDLHTSEAWGDTLEEALVTAILAFYRTKCGGI